VADNICQVARLKNQILEVHSRYISRGATNLNHLHAAQHRVIPHRIRVNLDEPLGRSFDCRVQRVVVCELQALLESSHVRLAYPHPRNQVLIPPRVSPSQNIDLGAQASNEECTCVCMDAAV
jgi:hypothetical protein